MKKTFKILRSNKDTKIKSRKDTVISDSHNNYRLVNVVFARLKFASNNHELMIQKEQEIERVKVLRYLQRKFRQWTKVTKDLKQLNSLK